MYRTIGGEIVPATTPYIARLRHYIEILVSPKKLFAAAAIDRIGVECLFRVAPEEDAVAGEALQSRICVTIVVVGAAVATSSGVNETLKS